MRERCRSIGQGTATATLMILGLGNLACFRSAPALQQTPTVTTAVVSPGGGTVELGGVGTVTFPAGAFRSPRQVTLSATSSLETQQLHASYGGWVPFTQSAPWELRINSGDAAPETPVTVSLVVPSQAAQDSVATAVISPEGGTVELEGFATVIFPAGAFNARQAVTVAATSSELTQTEYELTADDAPRRPFEIRINTGAVGPRTEVEVVLPVTDAFLSSLPADHQVELWVQLFETGGQEVLDQFRIFSSDFDAQSKTVRAQLPTEVFTDRRRADESFEVILLVGSTPVGR